MFSSRCGSRALPKQAASGMVLNRGRRKFFQSPRSVRTENHFSFRLQQQFSYGEKFIYDFMNTQSSITIGVNIPRDDNWYESRGAF